MNGLTCWNCGTEGKHVPKYEEDYLYVCANCGKVDGYMCRGCNELYLRNRLIKYGDVWVCKECNQPHWGYTEWKRTEDHFEKAGE